MSSRCCDPGGLEVAGRGRAGLMVANDVVRGPLTVCGQVVAGEVTASQALTSGDPRRFRKWWEGVKGLRWLVRNCTPWLLGWINHGSTEVCGNS